LDSSGSRPEIPGKLLNVALERIEISWTDSVSKRNITSSQGEEEHPTYNKNEEG
jgi:hypothetical protein